MSDPKTTASIATFTCPACEQEVFAQVTYSIALGNHDFYTREVPAKVTPVGLRINHDCTPKVTR